MSRWVTKLNANQVRRLRMTFSNEKLFVYDFHSKKLYNDVVKYTSCGHHKTTFHMSLFKWDQIGILEGLPANKVDLLTELVFSSDNVCMHLDFMALLYLKNICELF